MNIHEYQAKELLAKFGGPVPAGCDRGRGQGKFEELRLAAERGVGSGC